MFISPPAISSLAGLKETPQRLVIAKWGKNESNKGDFYVTHTTKRVLPALQKLLGFEEIVIDFEHNTVPGTPAYDADKEPRNIAAQNARLSVVEGEGIVAEGLKWTPSGEKSVKEGLHPDLSPTIKTNDAGEVVFVHSAALCRQGAVTDLRVHTATDILSKTQLALYSATLNPPQNQPSTTMDYKKLLILLLGLDTNASDADIENACKAFAENVKSVGEIKTHATTVQTLTTKLADLEKKLAATDRHAMLEEAIRAGKIVPHGAEFDSLTNEQFKAILEKLPADQVPLTQRTPEGVKTFSASSIAATGPVDDVRKALNISQETWEKHNKAA